MKQLGLVLPVLVGAVLGACGGAPEPRASAPESLGASAQLPAAPTAASVLDDCQQQPGKPAPDPLERTYTGVAAKARCQREVYTIMGGVSHFLGVGCGYCHLVPDFRAMTHRKEIANWMASELIPALQKKNGKEPWCNSCHTGPGGKGVAKILRNPRSPTFAVEWMTTHLVEDFQTKNGSPLHCKSCHQGNLGTPEFQRQIILTNRLPTDEK
ncbi:MAG TPA: hypothetical protein VGF76_26030 [Polyangiaceae bacterium]